MITGMGIGIGYGGQVTQLTRLQNALSRSASIHSLRRVKSSYTGPLCRVQRSSDNAQLDIPALANGDLDTYTLMNFVGAENLLTWSEDFSNAAWTAIGLTPTANSLTFHAIGDNISQYVSTLAGGVGTCAVILSGTAGAKVNVYLSNSSASIGAGIQITLTTTPTRYAISANLTGAANALMLIDNRSFYGVPAGDAVMTINCSMAQANTGSTALDYCKTTTAATVSGSGFVTKVYDQSGLSRDLVQATLANMPRLVNAGVIDRMTGGTNRPMLRTDGISQFMATGSYVVNQPFTRSSVLQFLNPTATSNPIYLDQSGGAAAEWVAAVINAPGTLAMYAGAYANYKSAIAVNNKATVVEEYQGSSSIASYNGVATATNPLTRGLDGLTVGRAHATATAPEFGSALFGDIIIFPSALSTTDRLALEASQKNYYGTP